MGLVRDRWKLSFRRSASSLSSPSPRTPSTASNPPDPPPEFLCPISGVLMADPVIIPSGETFERACIEACRDLSVSPPSLSLDLSSSVMLIPNSALRSAIIRWCDVAGVPHPLTVSSEVATRLARLHLSDSKSQTACSIELPNEISSPTASSSSSSYHYSSSSSSEIIAAPIPKTQPPVSPILSDPLEEKIMVQLKQAHIQVQESALTSLLEATRESTSSRIALGSPRLLAVLKDLLQSCHTAIKSTVLAIIVNLSLEPANKVRIVRSGVVPAIVNVLNSLLPSPATDHAAGALFSLAMDEQNRAVIGVLGAVPPLLRVFCSADIQLRARLEAGMALHYLGLAEINMAKVARVAGAVKGLVTVTLSDASELRRVAMRLMLGMVQSKEGKTVMLDGGAVDAAVALLRKEEQEEEEEEIAVRLLHCMSFGGLRFKGIARRAGAEEVLERAAARLEGEKRDMAIMTLKAIKGETDRDLDIARNLWSAVEAASAEEIEEEKSTASEPLTTRRRNKRNPGGGSGRSSSGF